VCQSFLACLLYSRIVDVEVDDENFANSASQIPCDASCECFIVVNDRLDLRLTASRHTLWSGLQLQDPWTKEAETDPTVVLAINFLLLMLSILALSQAVRMYIHAV
jgi:hypothetical protein